MPSNGAFGFALLWLGADSVQVRVKQHPTYKEREVAIIDRFRFGNDEEDTSFSAMGEERRKIKRKVGEWGKVVCNWKPILIGNERVELRFSQQRRERHEPLSHF